MSSLKLFISKFYRFTVFLGVAIICSVANAVDKNYELYPLNQPVSYDSAHTGKMYLLEGWSVPEEWGVWTKEKEAKLGINLMTDKSVTMDFEINPYLEKKHKYITVSVLVNGKKQTEWKFDLPKEGTSLGHVHRELTLKPLTDQKYQNYLITFQIKSPASPHELDSANMDTRNLGLGLIRTEIKK